MKKIVLLAVMVLMGWSVLQAQIDCPPVSIPYAYDFTTGSAGCWIVPGGVTRANGNIVGGARMDEGHVGSRVPIVSPEIDRSLAGLTVRYTVNAKRSFHPIVYIGVSDSGGSNVRWLDSLRAADGTNEYIYHLDTFSGTERHITFCGDFGTYLLDVSIDETGTCFPVSELYVAHLSDTAATLQWSPTVWPSQWAVYLGGVLQGTTNDSLFHLGGLLPHAKYIASVREICAAGDTSVARSIRFTTTCPPQTLPYSMDFENESVLDSICWHTTLYPFNGYPQAYINGTTSRKLLILAVTSEPNDPNYRNFVCTPLMDPQGHGVDINFRASLYSLDTTSFFDVGIMTDVADTANYIPIGSVTPTYSSSTYIDCQFTVPDSVLQQTFCLAFRFGGTLVRCYIDDINISLLPLPSYTLTLDVNDTAMGSVSGAGTYEEGSVVNVAAMPNQGYRFVNWNDLDSHALRQVVVTSDTTFTAFFARDTVPDDTTGIDVHGGQQPVVGIFPNPASAEVTVNVGEPSTLTVLDVTGRTVIPSTTLNAPGLTLSLALPTGTYFVRVTTDVGTVVKKLIVR